MLCFPRPLAQTTRCQSWQKWHFECTCFRDPTLLCMHQVTLGVGGSDSCHLGRHQTWRPGPPELNAQVSTAVAQETGFVAGGYNRAASTVAVLQPQWISLRRGNTTHAHELIACTGHVRSCSYASLLLSPSGWVSARGAASTPWLYFLHSQSCVSLLSFVSSPARQSKTLAV